METETVTEREVDEAIDVSEPNFWKVIILNDDKTTMEFVVMLLIEVFHKSIVDATKTMIEVHKNGSAVAGRYTFEIAEEKKETCMRAARTWGFPLKVTIEEEK